MSIFKKKKELSVLDIKSILLIIEDYNNTHVGVTREQKEFKLAATLEQFGVKVEYMRVPWPPRSQCYSPKTDVTTKPPTTV